MDCQKCGANNPDNMRFCGQCAAPLNLQCPSCGFENPFDFRFCGQCATNLSKNQSASTDDFPQSPLSPADVTSTPPYKGTYQGNSQGTSQTSTQATNQATTVSETTPPVISETKTTEYASIQTTPGAKPGNAERRQLTVLFCDMVGSSALSERIDPEELRDIMSDYRSICSDIVNRYDGYVAQYLGDGILVYFGFPHAHEDDARRAAHAALEIAHRIPQQTYPVQQSDDVQLAVRVGVHTGLVVVGGIGGGDKCSMALGETPNIAARIQGHAEQNTVVISDNTYQLLGEHFECKALGTHTLKGFSQPMTLLCVQQVRTQQDRYSGKSHLAKTKLVGRAQETDLLLERYTQARKGVGQIVLLNGEPGLGKTRLVHMLCEQTTGDQCIILECCGAPYYKNSFLFPIMDMVRRILGLNDITNDSEQLSLIEQSIAALGMNPQVVTPILAELLSVPLDNTEKYHLHNASFTPLQKKRQTLDTLVELLKTLAQQRFVLLIVEDLQWVDPSTVELLSQLVKQPGLNNIFAIFTFRNELPTPWQPRANLTQITLNRLTQKQSGSMIRQICRGKMLPLEVFTEIINKTDGIPFFVEELTHTVLRSSLLIEKEEHFELSSTMSQLGIPATLQDSLMSRLDNLGEDKKLAQLGATLGREFNHELLSAASSQDESGLCLSINRLVNAELLLQRGQPPKAQYRFQHALLREAAYHSLLKSTRQQYHQRIATLIKTKFPHIATDNPEILAHHCTEAGNYSDALNYWLAAGRYAIQRSANIEAAAHLNNGLTILKKIPATLQTNLRELALQTTLGLAVMMSKGYAAPEVEKAYARAYDLCKNISDENTVFPVLYGLWEFHVVRSDLNIASKLADELLHVAARSKVSNFSQEARRALGTTQFWKGEFSEALVNLDLPIDSESENNTSPATLVSYSQDAQVAAHANACCALWLLGKPKQAIERGQHALELAKRLSHPFSQAYALNFLGTVSQLCGDHVLTGQYADAQIALSETYGFSFWAATGRMLKAWADSSNHPPEVTCETFQQALNDYKRSGNRLARPYFQAVLVDLYKNAGQLENAQQVIEASLRESASTGEGIFTAELLRLKGELALGQNMPDYVTAETLFIHADAQACKQHADALSLRASTSLTRLLSTVANDDSISFIPQTPLLESRNRLQILLEKFPEDKPCTDIIEAQRVLSALHKPITNKTLKNNKINKQTPA